MWLKFWGATLLVAAVSGRSLKSALDQTPSISRLGGLLQQFGLLEKLDPLSNITILAPTNSAIQDLEDFGFDFNEVEPIVVQALLTYHVLNGRFSETSFSTSAQIVPTLLQPPLVTNVTGGAVAKAFVQDDDLVFESGLQKAATAVEGNIAFDGGLLHTIDSTLIFPHNISVTGWVAGLTSFLEAASDADMVPQIESLADVTVFIPTNQAFEDIGCSGSPGPTDELASTLQYHVLPHTVAYSNQLTSSSVITLQGSNLTVTIKDDGGIFVNDARVITTDLLIYGGVAHVIDKVLSPPGSKTLYADSTNQPGNGLNTAFHTSNPASESEILRAIFGHISQATGIMTGLWLFAVFLSCVLAWHGGVLDTIVTNLHAARGTQQSRTTDAHDNLEKGRSMVLEQGDDHKGKNDYRL